LVTGSYRKFLIIIIYAPSLSESSSTSKYRTDRGKHSVYRLSSIGERYSTTLGRTRKKIRTGHSQSWWATVPTAAATATGLTSRRQPENCARGGAEEYNVHTHAPSPHLHHSHTPSQPVRFCCLTSLYVERGMTSAREYICMYVLRAQSFFKQGQRVFLVWCCRPRPLPAADAVLT
jgi:hypothetical protein